MSQKQSSRRNQNGISRKGRLVLLGGSVLVFAAGATCFSWAIEDAGTYAAENEASPAAQEQQAARDDAGLQPATGQSAPESQEQSAPGTLVGAGELDEEPEGAEKTAGATAKKSDSGKTARAKSPEGKSKPQGKRGQPAKPKAEKKERAAAKGHAARAAGTASEPAESGEPESPTARPAPKKNAGKPAKRTRTRKVPVYRTVEHKAVEITRREGAATTATRGACPACGEKHAHDYTEKVLDHYETVAE